MYVETYTKPKLMVEYCSYCDQAQLIPFFKHKNNCPTHDFATYEREFLPLRCFILGHDFNHSSICDRCGLDIYFYYVPVSDIGMFIRKWINRINYFRYRILAQCPECNKPTHIFGRRVGNHDDCLPF